MSIQAIVDVDAKYQALFQYLLEKRQEWATQEHGLPSRYIRKKGKEQLAEELLNDVKFAQTKVVGFLTSPVADDVFAVVNAIASPYDFEWVFVADVLRDAILIAAGKKRRNNQLMVVGAVGVGTLLWGMARRGK